MIILTIIHTIMGSTTMLTGSIMTTTAVGAGCSQSSSGTVTITQTLSTMR